MVTVGVSPALSARKEDDDAAVVAADGLSSTGFLSSAVS